MFERCVSSNEYPNWGFATLLPIRKPIPGTLPDEVPPYPSEYESADRSASPILGLVARPHSNVAPVHRRPSGSRDRRGRIVSALVVRYNAPLPDLSSMPPQPRLLCGFLLRRPLLPPPLRRVERRQATAGRSLHRPLFLQTRCIAAAHCLANRDDSYSGQYCGSLRCSALPVCDHNAGTAAGRPKEPSHFEQRRIAAIPAYCHQSPTEPVRTA